MTMWLPNLNTGSGPLFKRLSNAIAESVKNGHLRCGVKMPTQRSLADTLGLSLNTVSHAYSDATDRGFLRGEVGRGTYVRSVGPLETQHLNAELVRENKGPIDFSLNLPSPGQAYGPLAKSLVELASADNLPALLDYQNQGQLSHHTSAAAQWLQGVGLDAEPDSIILTTGAQQGIMATLLAVMRPGDVLLTNKITYAPIQAMARHLGLKLLPVVGDTDALCPDALDSVCSQTSAKVLYCTPTLSTPDTITMSEDIRSRITSVARKHDLILIEDDVFGFLPETRPLPLSVFAPERTIYITSVSKSLAPGLRVGYLQAPQIFQSKVQTAVQLSCWMPPPLMVEIASRWITEGTAMRLNEYQRQEASARQVMAKELLPDELYQADPNGFHVWLSMPEGLHVDRFQLEAEAQGVKVLTGSAFSIDPSIEINAARLCLTHEATRTRVKSGLQTIANIIENTHSVGEVFL